MENDSLEISRDLLKFISQSPTSFHVVSNMRKLLDENGFACLQENQHWNLEKGGRYYVVRNGSSIIAFVLPEEMPDHFQITAAHSDSPAFRLKTNPYLESAGHYVQLNVEKYGGAILAPWLDRPLSVAGRVIVKCERPSGAESAGPVMLQQRLVNIDRDLVLIPNLAIHMNRQVNDGYAYKVQKDLLPVFGDETSKGRLEDIIAELLDIKKEQIAAADLFLYNRTPGTIWGAGNEYISSPRLDDLQCAWSCLKGLISAEEPEAVCVCGIFDNEEVGSLTKQGADSTFLYDILRRISSSLGFTEEDYLIALAGSFMISADNAHAVHPRHMDAADPVHRPAMNLGPVIKYSANQKYTTDAVSGAVFQSICEKAGVPYQVFHNNSDIAGGSTLGNISNAHVSLNAVDIGLAQLAMHSPYETAGTRDTAYMIRAIDAFYRTNIENMGQRMLL